MKCNRNHEILYEFLTHINTSFSILSYYYYYYQWVKLIQNMKKNIKLPTSQEFKNPSPFASIKRVQFLESHKTNVVLDTVDDGPLSLFDVKI